jgi:hypothetical protein
LLKLWGKNNGDVMVGGRIAKHGIWFEQITPLNLKIVGDDVLNTISH